MTSQGTDSRIEQRRLLRNEPLWACSVQFAKESPGHGLVHRRRPRAHNEHPVEELIPVAVTGHPVQLSDGEWAAEARPGLVGSHGGSLLFTVSTLLAVTDNR